MSAASILVCLLALAPAHLFAQGPEEANPLPVRSTTRWGADLIAEGCRKSLTFRGLVNRLRKTMVIVYVQPVRELSGFMRGATTFLGLNGAYRYIRLSVGTAAARKQVIALVAHELQHASEIAAAPEVTDDASLALLYERIGDHTPDGFDTQAARDTGLLVWKELWTHPSAFAAPAEPGPRGSTAGSALQPDTAQRREP